MNKDQQVTTTINNYSQILANMNKYQIATNTQI